MKVNEIIEQDSTLGSAVAMYTTTYKGKDLSEKNTKDIISIVEVPGKPIWVYFKAIELSSNKENSLGFICKSIIK